MSAPLMLSISGLRGIIGASLTPTVAARYGSAIGQWLKATRTDRKAPHVVIGRDSRPSGQMIELAATAGLVAVGCRVTNLGIATTPGVAVMVDHHRADGGVIITASHNPIQWNGLKTLRHDGVAPPPHEAQAIIDAFRRDAYDFVAPMDLQPSDRDDEVIGVHVDRVLRVTQVDVDAIRRRKLKVVVDSVHGAGGPEAKELLSRLGVELVHLWGEPTGIFPHTPEPLKENLTALAQAVREHGADAGFAQDPDADRLAVVDNTGTYIGEEYTLALAALHALSRPQRKSGSAAVLVANLSTSRMIDDIAARHSATVMRSPVGEANVAELMRRHNALLGGEGNGGVIWPGVSFVRDSLVGIAFVLELLAGSDRKLDQIAASIPAYAIVKEKYPVDPAVVARLKDALATGFPGQRLDTQDGVRIDWPDRWVHVRPSNTEPILRIIAEARDEAAARELIERARKALKLS